MPTGGGGGQTTTVQKSDPWSGIQPQLLQAVGDTQRLYNQGSATGTPDVTAYQRAMADYNASGGAQDFNAWLTSQGPDEQGTSSGARTMQQSDYQKYLKSQPARGPAPTQDQFMQPGTGTGSPLAPNYFPGNTVAQFAPQQQQAIDMTTQRATNGSPVNAANSGMLTNTLNGNYLDPSANPYLKGTYDQAAKAVTGSVNGSFGQGGRYGSGLNQNMLEQNLGVLANNIYGGNYQAERKNQLGASALGPQAANQDYTDLSALSNAGGALQGQSQANINDQMARYNYTQGQPMQQLQNYLGLLNGTGVGNTQTQTSPYYNNQAAGMLGTGLGALGAIGGLGSLGTAGFAGFGPGAAAISMGGSGLLGGLSSALPFLALA